MFTKEDNEKYDSLMANDLVTVRTFWVKAYKAHTTYIQSKAGANEYESAAYATQLPTTISTSGSDTGTFISMLKETVAQLMTECKDS